MKEVLAETAAESGAKAGSDISGTLRNEPVRIRRSKRVFIGVPVRGVGGGEQPELVKTGGEDVGEESVDEVVVVTRGRGHQNTLLPLQQAGRIPEPEDGDPIVHSPGEFHLGDEDRQIQTFRSPDKTGPLL